TFEAESRPADSVQRGPARRVLWIAIDGADWSRMEALFASGRLPHLKRLRDEGATAPLETLFPTWSPRIWTSLATGRAPESHGVLDFVEYRARGGACGVQRLRRQNRLPAGLGLHRVVEALIAAGQLSQMPVTSCQRRVPSLWNIASSAGVRSTTVGWYASWPTDPVNGYIVSDLNPIRAAFRDLGFRFRDEVGNEAREAAARTGLTAPPSLLGELVANVEIPNIPDDPEAILALPFFEELTEEQRARESERSLLQVFRSIYQSDVFSVGSTEYLFRRDPGDLVSVYFSGVDNTSHRFTQPGVVDRYYDVADEFVGRLVAAAGPDVTTLIVSDHGWAYADLVDERFGHGHAPDGIFILHGPEIPALRLKAKPHVYDVAPTLLALLGLPADERMEGRAVLEALPEAARAESRRPRVDYGSYAYTPAASVAPDEVLQDEMMHRLKALGYVDE
ncbi:MAG: alkaline phosphatase family protein, partial [Myxococcota bacterium]|nr:alkaline phosphatase family protein [Myxococcota bacterium]